MVVPHCESCQDEASLIYTDYKIIVEKTDKPKSSFVQVTYVCSKCDCSAKAIASCDWTLPLSRYYETLVV